VTDPQPIIDSAAFGLELRLLRMRRGYARPEHLTAVMKRDFGIVVSERTIWAIERGDQLPRLDTFLAMLAVLGEGPEYFYPTFGDDAIARMTRSRDQR